MKGQKLAAEEWELVVIDNASSKMGAGRWELGGIKNAIIVREERLGLTHARVRGLGEAKGEIVVVVNDGIYRNPNQKTRKEKLQWLKQFAKHA